MKVEEYRIASKWLDENVDKWHMEHDEPIWDVPIDEIPDLVKQFFIDRKECHKRMLERIKANNQRKGEK